MENHLRIGVFGVSGVGKTTLIKRVAAQFPQKILHLQGSELIKEAMNEKVTSEDIRLISEEDIQNNQEKMIQEYWRKIDHTCVEAVIFDGHCVIDNGHEFVKIPSVVIKDLNLSHLVFVHDNPKSIFHRRINDAERSRPYWTIQKLSELQEVALDVCDQYRRDLEISLLTVNVSDDQALRNLLLKVDRS